MKKGKSDIFVYKLTCDNGGAPCVENGLISLCICKPYIRKSAREGDWIIGMGGKELKNRLIYVMRVGRVVPGKVYYSRDGEYKHRSDCIYEWDGRDFKRRKDAQYHYREDLRDQDLGKPEEGYKRARCLVSACFAYFGDGKKDNPCIKKIEGIYDNLGRSHQKKPENSEDYKMLKTYIKWILKEFGCGNHSTPTHSDTSGNCGNTEDEVLQCCPKRKKQS